MDIKKISEKGKTLKILLNGIDTTLLNAWRRTVMNAVPTFAAENITIYENSSIMPDEMLTHRIGLLPIRAQEKKSKSGDTIKLSLEKEGPCMVYSGDIQVVSGNAEIPEQQVQLVKLKKDQKIKMEIEAVAGTGKEHAKWQPALFAYKQLPKITFESAKNSPAILKACPAKSIELKAGKLFLTDPIGFSLYGFLAEKFPEDVTVDFDTDSFVVTIETYGGKTNKEILLEGLETIQQRNQEFEEALKK